MVAERGEGKGYSEGERFFGEQHVFLLIAFFASLRKSPARENVANCRKSKIFVLESGRSDSDAAICRIAMCSPIAYRCRQTGGRVAQSQAGPLIPFRFSLEKKT
jgi:hypothetical protein